VGRAPPRRCHARRTLGQVRHGRGGCHGPGRRRPVHADRLQPRLRGAIQRGAAGLGPLSLLASARYLPDYANRTLLTALGLTSSLYAILDIKSDILDRPHLESDARMLAELTHVPTLIWGVLWISIALAVSWWLLARAYRRT
jgi:hypothetical protein